MIINGEFIETEKPLKVTNPYDGKVVGEVPKSERKHVQMAVEAARKAAKKSRILSPYERYTILKKTAEDLRNDRERVSKIITLESGKPISESKCEIIRAFHTLMFSAEFSRNIEGETIPLGTTECKRKKLAITVREPMGVIGAITPFNFPVNLVVHKLGPGIAGGNSFVLKPAPQTPLSSIEVVKSFHRNGLPDGILNVVNGKADIGEELIKSEVDMITFTGSVEVGEKITRNAGIKKLCLELGGNDPLIVMDDADIEAAASEAVMGAFGNAGQRCTSIKRILLHGAIADEFIKIFIQNSKKLIVGDPQDEKTDIGTVIDENAAKVVECRIKKAVNDGAKMLLGGKREGALMWPAILDNVNEESELIQKETFGPVAPIIRFKTKEDALRISNTTDYGLQAGVFTKNIDNISFFTENLDVGGVIINAGPGYRDESIPFGGVKKTGYGREGIRYAIEEMTRIKTIVI